MNSLACAGYHYNNPTEYFDGSLDEARLSDIVRSVDWINTEFNNYSDTDSFYSLGTEQSVILNNIRIVILLLVRL